MAPRALWLAGALGLGCAHPAVAIVNIERLRLEAPQPGWSGHVELALSGRSGNSNYQLLDAGVRVDWHRAPDTVFLVLQRVYGSSEGEPNADNSFAHLRGVRQVTPSRAVELFLQLQQDEFRRLESRVLSGGGARLRLHDRPGRSALFLGLGGFVYEERLEANSLEPAFTEQALRASAYLACKYRIDEGVDAMSTTYYQPRPDRPEDFRALEQATLSVRLTRRLDLQLTLDVIHDSEPPVDVERTDVTYHTRFVYSF